MNKRLFIPVLLLLCCVMCFAQSQDEYIDWRSDEEQEEVAPLSDTEITRNVNIMNVEGVTYYDVKVELKAISPDYVIHDKERVKIKIKNATGKIIYKKTLASVYLYLYGDGQIEVKQKNFLKLAIWKSKKSGYILGEIKEKEGLL